RVIDKLPYVALTCVIAFLTLHTQRPELGGGRTSYYGGSPQATFLTMIPVVKRYLQLLVWPRDLKVFYEPAIKKGIDGEVAAAALLLGLVAWSGFLLYRRNRGLFFWWGLFFIGLVPVLQIVPLTTLMNDRYLYFPLLGGAALFAGAMEWLRERVPSKWRRWSVGAVCLLLLPLPVLAKQRTEVWKNPVTLVQDYLRGKNDAEQREARALVLEKIIAKMEAGKSVKARELLHVFVGAWPDYAPGFAALGNSYYMSGDMAEAQRYLARALELDPRSAPVLLALGNISLAQRDLVKARELYLRALASGGDNPEAEYGLACLESLSGHHQEALAHLVRATRLGFRDMERIRTNRELDAVRTLPGFKQLMEHYARKE
ncbi:MAG TPA: tetratricopeptide repeat protein, partial [Geobacteraceae bacterium]